MRCRILKSVAALLVAVAVQSVATAADPLKVLFLGDEGHHRPAERFAQVQGVLADRGIEMVYTDSLDDLSADTLDGYDALAVFANIDSLPGDAEAAILNYVREGGGIVPLHCASFCFRDSPAWIALVGAQFERHGAGEFRTEIVAADHPVMQGFEGFESWDETYVHRMHNDRGRTVLEVREENGGFEPWTWVRSEGKGRVFYTAWGHDQRTWSHPGFQNLLERGIRYATGGDPADAGPYVDHPQMTVAPSEGLEPFGYQPAKVPFYVPDAQWGTVGEPITTMQKPLSPEESLKHVTTPEGFEAELFAAEPLIAAKPLAITFAADGGLYVAESVDYPNSIVLPGEGTGHDRIVRLDDTDGDGVADSRHVFAEGLSIPTSILPHQSGLIVAQAPHILFLADDDGDGVADRRDVLSTGWGTRDTHSGPSNLTWGLDGWVYGIVGYSGFQGTVGGEQIRFGQGFFRFLPDGSKLEFLRSTNNNSWGFGFSEEGVVFGSTANGNPSEYMPLPNRVYERVRGWTATTLRGIAGTPRMEIAPRRGAPDGKAPVRQVDHHGRFTAAAGHRLYTARAYPEQYWNSTAFVCEPTGHVVAAFEITPSGADFRSRMAYSQLASDDEWTAPIIAEVGPDGSLWIVDWYNFIVQHNPTPEGFDNGKGNAYETPLRDKIHGRIWRLTADGSDGESRSTLAGATTEELVAALTDTNMLWRTLAQRALIDRAAGRADGGRDVAAGLIALVHDRSVDAVGLNPAAIHALWTLRGLGLLEGEHADADAVSAVLAALEHPSSGVRMNAVKALPKSPGIYQPLAESEVAHDMAPLVRLALLEVLSEWPSSPEAGRLVTEMLADRRTFDDAVLTDAATAAAAVQAAHVFPGLVSIEALVDPKRIALVERVAEHVARGGKAAEVDRLVAHLADTPPALAAAAVAGLARGWPRGTPIAFGEASERVIVGLMARLPVASQGDLIAFVQRSGSDVLDDAMDQVVEALMAVIEDAGSATDARSEAAARLVSMRPADSEAAIAVLELIDARTSPELASGLLTAVGLSKGEGVAEELIEKATTQPPAVRDAAFRLAVGNADWVSVLVDAIEDGTVRLTDLPLVERNRLAEHPDEKIRERAREMIASGGGLPDADRQKVIDEILPIVLAGGNTASGKAIFKEQCGKCHRHSGEGGQVGPDLTGMAVHPPQELLIHILDPNRSVEGNFRAYTVITEDGKVVTGLLASESRTAIEIVDAEAKRFAIQRDEIDEFLPSSNSLMPVGFEKQIPPEKFADLLAFLTAKGKYLPLPLSKAATVVSTRGMFYDVNNRGETVAFDDWGPKTFNGIPFQLVDPVGDSVPNVIMLTGPIGQVPPTMPSSVSMPLSSPAKAIHILGGISGWGAPASAVGTVSMTVRLHYEDGEVEEHPLVNGEHLVDYVRRIDVPGSEYAFELRGGRQLRYLAIEPQRKEMIRSVELAKGDDSTAPIVMAITAELP
jgi:putative membrane-bound dehydrogenase-like protein